MEERTTRRFTEFVKAVYEHKTPTFRGTKLQVKKIADACGVNHPSVLREFDGLGKVTFEGLPERFVFKVDGLSSTRGVFPLVREGEHFFDLLRRKPCTRADILGEMTALLQAKNRLGGERAFVEELVEGENGRNEIPYDYKFFAFGDFIPLIEQIERAGPVRRMNFFGADFSPLPKGLIELKQASEGTPVVPKNAAAMIEAVQRLARFIDVPFLRIDLYTSGTQVYLGELTPGPGPAFHGTLWRFSPQFDGEMGGYWTMRCHMKGIPLPKISKIPPAIRKDKKDAKQKDRLRLPRGLARPLAGMQKVARLLNGLRKRALRS